MEIVCWACNAPIDKTKPSTPYQEEEIAAEEQISKKSKKEQEVKKTNNIR